ncbi:MAG: SLBB domain-containing protein [Aliarcobacter sp.]|nr:SLBB domain-containing protein [Aliarcobacter sp.]
MYLNKNSDITLKSGDEIVILNKYDLKDKPYIFTKGDIVNDENNKVDYYEGLKAKNLFDIVKFKTEKDGNAYYVDKSKVQVNRLENNEKITLLVNIEQTPNFEIKAYDEIVFFDFFKTNEIKKATIKGEIFIAGTYNITEKTTINDLITIAGGFTKKTLMNRCEVARYEVKGDQRIRTILSLDLKKAMDLNLQVMEDDEWTIFAIENWNDKMYIELKGEVRYPGKIYYSRR